MLKIFHINPRDRFWCQKCPNATNTESSFNSSICFEGDIQTGSGRLAVPAASWNGGDAAGQRAERRLQPGEALAAAAAHVAVCRTCDPELFSAGEVRRGREEGNGTQPVLAAPWDGGDAVRQARVRDTERGEDPQRIAQEERHSSSQNISFITCSQSVFTLLSCSSYTKLNKNENNNRIILSNI